MRLTEVIGCALLKAAVTIAVTAPLAFAQAPSSFHLPKHPLVLSKPEVQFHLENVDISATWIVGVRADSGAKPVVAIGAAELSPGPTSGTLRLVKAAQAEPRSFRIQSGVVSVDAAAASPSGRGGIFIYAVVPSSTRVRCMLNGSVVADTMVADHLLVRNGSVVDEPVPGLNHVILRLQVPKPPEQAPIVRLPDGSVRVSTKLLKDHLADGAEVAIPAMTDITCNCSRVASLILVIDQTGRVTVTGKLGDQSLAANAAGAVSQLRFQPFEYQGNVVPVRATLIVSASISGEVRLRW